jgi:hypothetical protein
MEKAAKSKKQLALELVHLTADEKKRALRPRDGFVAQVQAVMSLVKANPGTVKIPSFDPDEVLTELDAYAELEAPLQEADVMQAALAETRLYHAANAWGATLKAYRYLKVAALDDPALARGIANMEAFLAKGHKKKASKTSPPPSTGNGNGTV